MKNLLSFSLLAALSLMVIISSCEDPENPSSELHAAFAEFSENTTITSDGTTVSIESTGLPNHTSPYWSSTHELYIDPTVTTTAEMAPGNIDNFSGTISLSVPANLEIASSTTSTGLGAIGIAVAR